MGERLPKRQKPGREEPQLSSYQPEKPLGFDVLRHYLNMGPDRALRLYEIKTDKNKPIAPDLLLVLFLWGKKLKPHETEIALQKEAMLQADNDPILAEIKAELQQQAAAPDDEAAPDK